MSGCSTCGTGKVGGCKNNGGCSTGGCNKMNVFDWISIMDLPKDSLYFDWIEIRFKNGRKDFYKNLLQLELYPGDAVVVDAQPGFHIGKVSMTGELVRLQMQKKNVDPEATTPKNILRKAGEKDLAKWDQTMNRESSTLYRTRELIQHYDLQMKLSDVEFQADNSKATFYYSAEERVDFRELIKALAAEFKVRIEMKQISLRQEAGRIGGIGVCGRELCCSTWLSEFKNVSTAAARYQNLSLNPAKLSGQCGRLKCCLNYELDSYMEALKDIPQVEKAIKTKKGDARLQKTDIFRKILWFAYEDDETNWLPISAERVRELIKQNEEGKIPEFLSDAEHLDHKKLKENATSIVAGDLTRMDDKLNQKKKKKKKKKKKRPQDAQNNGQLPPQL